MCWIWLRRHVYTIHIYIWFECLIKTFFNAFSRATITLRYRPMSKAKTDVNVFNNSFALCLLASGCSEKQNLIEIIDKVEKNTKSNWNLIEPQLIKYWNDWQAWPQLIKIKMSEIISGLGLVFCAPATVYLLGEPHFWVQSKSLVILNTKKL